VGFVTGIAPLGVAVDAEVGSVEAAHPVVGTTFDDPFFGGGGER
jgi:hypothetical protein